MSTLERAIAIATKAHGGQVDKAGAPYILHVLRVMQSLEGSEEQIVAALHDVIEDCPDWSFERLSAEGFSSAVLTALECVTKREGEDYEAFVRRAASNPIARAVKLADLKDNSDLSRLAELTEKDCERAKKYAGAIKLLLTETDGEFRAEP